MGSRASSQAKMPGMPGMVDFVWLAGLLDRAGGFTAEPAGIKITGPVGLTQSLYMRFGGRLYLRDEGKATWWQTRQTDLRLMLPHLYPHLIVRGAEGVALGALLEHMAERKSYHGSKKWRAERDRLRAAVAGARPPRLARAAAG